MAADTTYPSVVQIRQDGNLAVPTGKSIDIESGASLKIAGTAVTATAAELNAIAGGGLSTAELGVLDGVTPGTAAASKALVLDSSLGIATITSATVTTLTAPTIAGTTAFTGRLTTTDGVTSGTAKVVGGLANSGTSASDAVTAAASNNSFIDFATTYSIPASTLKAGSVLRARAMAHVTNASGTDTLSFEMQLGSTVLVVSTAVDPTTTSDLHILDFEIVSRAAPSGTSSLVGSGRWISNTSGTIAHGTGLLAATNFATNGALVLKCSAKWSSNTASTSATLESFNVWID